MKFLKIIFWLAIIWIILMFWVFLVQSAKASWCPIKKNTSPEIQDVICYFWQISPDPDFILTIERESGFYPEAKGYNTNGTFDWGLGQLNSAYHSKFINSKPNWIQQAHYVAEVYARASREGKLQTTFYGYGVRNTVKDRFIFFKN